jgi:hypothetical protein
MPEEMLIQQSVSALHSTMTADWNWIGAAQLGAVAPPRVQTVQAFESFITHRESGLSLFRLQVVEALEPFRGEH